MTVESVTYIDDLDPTYPASSDLKSEGDNHIRNIKTGLKNTFPNVDAPVTATEDELNILDGATLTTAEINYVDGVTSNIQTQLDAKASSTHTHTAGDLTIASTDLTDTADLTYNADTDVSGNSWVVDEDDMSSDLATKVPTQQSVKAYVDNYGNSWQLITSWTPTATTSQDFTLDSSSYTSFRVVGEGIAPATDNIDIYLRLGHTGGTVFLSGATDYQNYAHTYDGNFGGSTQRDSFMLNLRGSNGVNTTLGVGSDAGEGISFDLIISGMASTVTPPMIEGTCAWVAYSGSYECGHFGGHLTVNASTAFDAMRLFTESGNFDTVGKVYVYGLKNS